MKATRREILALAAMGALERVAGETPRLQASPSEAPAGSNQADFDQVWELVRDRFYDPRLNGLDWQDERARFRPQAASARSREDAAAAINAMLAQARRLAHALLHAGRSGLLPARRYFRGLRSSIAASIGSSRADDVSYPGIGVFTEADGQGRMFVTGVIEGAPAHGAGDSGRRRNPVGGRPAIPAGRLVPRQGRRRPFRSKSAARPARRRSRSTCRRPIFIQTRCSCAA